eukprot:TRINITY_DN1061_c1_g2_i1.p1 TRINITY_DN1061_c1_g2~~TRINITY_DN1061_c1_g2_i1.p1  ORF type:complete len:732 (-),score=136.17 TRINITY_DN1061_c1_g2_i1:161-2356(-)
MLTSRLRRLGGIRPSASWVVLGIAWACWGGGQGGARAEDDDDGGGGKKSSDILEVMAWCKEIQEGLDWQEVLRMAKTECFENEDDNAVLRIRCSEGGLESLLDATRHLLDLSSERSFACANGLAFVLAVTLTYRREALSAREVARAHTLLWSSLQENFLMDASIWPVKTHDVLELFDQLPPALELAPLPLPASARDALDQVTFVVPRCPPELASALRDAFPNVLVFAGVRGDGREVAAKAPKRWRLFRHSWSQPIGVTLNAMLAQVPTPMSLVVVGSALPRSPADVERMVRVLSSRRVAAVGGPLVDADRVYSDFCHKLRPWRYRLSFDAIYEHSVIFDEQSAAAIRGSWFREESVDGKQGPCKLCDTLPPTFLGRTDALYALRFQPMLDGEWAILDLALRASRMPLVEFRGTAGASQASPGRRHVAPAMALCPFVSVREVSGLEFPHLYGRRDLPRNGVSPALPWFGGDGLALAPSSGDEGDDEDVRVPGRPPRALMPEKQFQSFMDLNHLREYVGLDGVTRHSGCTLSGVNCPVPNWVYRGWAAPPCCKETMRHLLFYIGEVFSEMGIRYIVTDGVLLGSYKYGGMLDWDADVDLHIHDDDFHRLESEVEPRVASDGHHLRKHVNNRSWLLQANNQNYLLIELNKRSEPWDPESVWQLPIEGRLFPAMDEAHVNLSAWYGMSFFRHRLRHVPEWEEAERPMYCATPYHYNCVDETQVPGGKDCLRAGIC